MTLQPPPPSRTHSTIGADPQVVVTVALVPPTYSKQGDRAMADFCGMTKENFDLRVKELRGQFAPRQFQKKRGGKKLGKKHATPEQWAAHLDWDAAYRKRPNTKKATAVRQAKYYKANREKLIAYAKDDYRENKEQKKAYQRSDSRKAYGRKYSAAKRRECPEKVCASKLASHKKRLKNDLCYRIKCRLRTRLRNAIAGNFKAGSAVRDLGCSIEFLKQRFKSMFRDGMSWDNYGTVWVIDHIFPLAAARLSDRVEFLAVNNWRNLQPLTPEENIEKGDKVYPEAQVLFNELCEQFSPEGVEA